MAISVLMRLSGLAEKQSGGKAVRQVSGYHVLESLYKKGGAGRDYSLRLYYEKKSYKQCSLQNIVYP